MKNCTDSTQYTLEGVFVIVRDRKIAAELRETSRRVSISTKSVLEAKNFSRSQYRFAPCALDMPANPSPTSPPTRDVFAWPTRCSVRKAFALVAVAVLSMTCVFTFVTPSMILCLLDGNCDGVKWKDFSVESIYPRTIAMACFVTCATMARKYHDTMPAYERNVSAYESYSPTTAAERRKYALFDATLVTLCLFAILPINLLRLFLLYAHRTHPMVLAFFVFMYSQNVGMCLVETRFVAFSYALGKKFANVNRDLAHLGEETPDLADPLTTGLHRRVTYGDDFYNATADRRHRNSVANAIEVLRIRHRLIREAVTVLVDAFGVAMGMSLITLCVMTLFDIYYQVFGVMGATSRSPVFIYMWLLQYSIRFYAIVVTAHNTAKQVNSRKTIPTNECRISN